MMVPGLYARDTSVSVERTRAEIEATLTHYGADAFAYATGRPGAQIDFSAHGRHVRFFLPLPDAGAEEFTRTGAKKLLRDQASAYRAWEQACRQRWRALLLAIKAKLEAVEIGISEFDREFLAYIVDPATGRTVAEVIVPQLAASYAENKSAPLLLAAPAGRDRKREQIK